MHEPQSVNLKASSSSHVLSLLGLTVTNILIMEDESGVKAPVTRLRRRLSVDQPDDAKSSSAPNTPTKKRGGRRTVKTELDLIDENAPDNNTPKTLTKKSNMKELEVDEKPVTPSRRSARIKSNTSIVLESTQAIDSPRAKRATRRNSQVGSDNEAPLTPARQTRRTRRDSANADKGDSLPINKPVVPISEIIVEEPETSSQKSSNSENPSEQSQSPSGIRKSPRLSLKKNRRSDSLDLVEKEKKKLEQVTDNKNGDSMESNEKEIQKSEELNNSNKENETSQDKKTSENVLPVIKLVDISNNTINVKNNRLSASQVDMINTEPKQKNINLNKSSPALIDTQSQYFKNKRHRTKSWSALSDSVKNDNKCYSDSESSRKVKRILNKTDPHTPDAQSLSKIAKNNLNLSANKNKKSVPDISIREQGTDLVDLPSNKEKFSSSPANVPVDSTTKNLFDLEPTNNLQTLVYIVESDSNSESVNVHGHINNKDQCIPTAQTHCVSQETSPKKDKSISNFDQDNKESGINKNDTCEPMDIDETIPDSSTISNKSLLKTTNLLENKDSTADNSEPNISAKEKDKSRRSLLNLNTSQTLNKTANENKSTLVLSQLKDIANESNVSQSPEIAGEKKLSNSVQELNCTQSNEVDKKNRSLSYLTSTPLQQRSLIKHVIQVNTSDIISNNTSKIDKSPKINESRTKKSTNQSEDSASDGETSQEESNFMDDEAEEASEDYESGDSRDEKEEQYEKENEIFQKGETLTSEDELSNDTDYEKDSFVVSSDEEDAELLDGSGDDLSMSDNELKMSTKSKKKYNDRKMKEQKKASREMFESRHKLNISDKGNKPQPTKLKKNRAILDSSDTEDENIPVKINKRMRIDSSQEISMNKSLENTSKNKLNKSLPKSLNNENNTEEVEMTVIEDNIKDVSDPLKIQIKDEPKTPQKLNASIQFIDPKNSGKRENDTNRSQLNMTLADDPLQESDTSDSSMSGNNIHIQNYDSILNDLNKTMKTKKSKEGDISLNIDKKPKQKAAPIVDQLNLTGLKLKKKKQNEMTLANSEDKFLSERSKKSASKKESNDKDSDNESSASIDLHLLFSEDSNNSEDVRIKDKKKDQIDEDDNFIPLRKSHGKTNILETSGSNDKPHIESTKKIKNKNRALDESGVENENFDGNETNFFLDNTGCYNSTEMEKSLNASMLKKKKGKVIEHEDSDSDAPMEVSNKNALDTEEQHAYIENENTANTTLVTPSKSKTKSPKSDKKKKKTESITKEQTDSTENQADVEDIMETKDLHSGKADKSINKSISEMPKSEKKNSKRKSESKTADQEGENLNYDASMEVSNKSVMGDIEEINTVLTAPNKSLTKTPKSDKKKKRTSGFETVEFKDGPENIPASDANETEVNKSGIANKSINKSISKTPKSEKRKTKDTSESLPIEKTGDDVSGTERKAVEEQNTPYNTEKQEYNNGAPDDFINKSVVKTPKSEKKKKRLSESQPEIQLNEVSTETGHNVFNTNKQKSGNDVSSEDSAVNKTKLSSNEKAKSKKISESSDANNTGNADESGEITGSKKRKRKSSLNQVEKEPDPKGTVHSQTVLSTEVSVSTINQNKKRKISHNVEDSENQAPIQNAKTIAIEKPKKRDTVRQRYPMENQIIHKRDNTDVNLNNKRTTIKRKEREDDVENIMTKVPTAPTSVPRLPANILNQLEDKPAKKTRQVTKSKAISTTDFVVEETKFKKIKPSNYLEESIYLNEEDVLESKKQKHIKNPKVLPFLPTVSTSNSGYTTNFKVNILPKVIHFVAKSTNVNNYKNDYLQGKKNKRLGTYDLYKTNRTIKMSKF